jgi:3-hydroxyisobutyrate dehydrogenase-like beta-hydroxyacid dehydrogenase
MAMASGTSSSVCIGVLHPGEMGATVAAQLAGRGHRLLWASTGRGPETAERAERAGLEDVGTLPALTERSDVVLSVCPPHAALDLASAVERFSGLWVDANAVAPATAHAIAARIEAAGATFVDGAIVGPPPHRSGTTRLYLSGSAAARIASLFEGTALEAVVIAERIGSASAIKMAYAAWTKGSQALLLAARGLARAEGVEDALIAEWELSQPELLDRSQRAAAVALRHGWRWAGEMEEIARALAQHDLPVGFHESAAELYARVPRVEGATLDEQAVDAVMRALATARDVRR